MAGRDQEQDNALVLSFLAVRRALGGLGFILPTLLLTYGWFSGNGVEPSISDFYHTEMGDIFVGVMCAIGVFLFTYTGYAPEKGEWLSDKLVARVAGAAAVGVALFPVHPLPAKICSVPECPVSGIHDNPAWTHFGSAGIFFASLAVFCLVLFPRTGGLTTLSAEKQRANRIYKTCGWLIVVSLIGLVGTFFIVRKGGAMAEIVHGYDLIFWIEAVGVVAFATSWLTKGKAMQPLRTMWRRAEPPKA